MRLSAIYHFFSMRDKTQTAKPILPLVSLLKNTTFLLVLILLASCGKEKFYSGQTTLGFSQDTVWFDTIFTRPSGSTYPLSVTKIAWIKNPENGTVKASFRLGGGKSSRYRINVDGIPGPEINGLEIPAKDSIFVFIQCSLEANGQNGPALVMDSLLSVVNGKEQKIILGAYGWDAHYFKSTQLPCNGFWDDKIKPYVIVDNVEVPEGCTFTIKAGVKVYNSARSTFFVSGKLQIEGNAAERVLFTGDKPVFDARFLPNQWVGIHFLRGSSGSYIRYADVMNATIGIRVDSLPVSAPVNLTLDNSKIMFCGQVCVAGITANIDATNCLLAQSGSYTFLGLLGGNYNFRHCTFASYAGFSSRQDGHFAITNTLRDGNGRILQTAPLTCNTFNSVIYGSLQEELTIDKGGSALFTTDFKGNFIRSKSRPFLASDNSYNIEPKFKDIMVHDFRPDTLSPLQNAGILLNPAITIDLNGNPRTGNPDVGCFERPD